MTVWQLIESDVGCGEFVVATFTTKRKAMEYLAGAIAQNTMKGWLGPDWGIEEYELDPVWITVTA